MGDDNDKTRLQAQAQGQSGGQPGQVISGLALDRVCDCNSLFFICDIFNGRQVT
jgi:hypothetical protein